MTASVWTSFDDQLRASEPYRRLRDELGDVTRLPPAAAAWVLALLAEDLERPCLVLLAQESRALAWIEAVQLLRPRQGETPVPEPVYFPAPALTPYQEKEPSLLIRAQESTALDAIYSSPRPTVVSTPRALFRLLPRQEDFSQAVLTLRPGQDHPLEELARHLIEFGYRRTDLVGEVGEFAVRGGVFDLFSPGQPAPIRLDLYGDTVESMRRFDAVSQRSSDRRVEEVRVLPLSLYREGPEAARQLSRVLESRLGPGAGFEATQRLVTLGEGETFTGWEHYLPLLARETGTLASTLSRPLIVLVDPPALEAEVDHYLEILQADFQARREQQRMVLPPDSLMVSEAEVRGVLEAAHVRLQELLTLPAGIDFQASATDLFHNQLPRFPREVETARARGERILLVSPSEHHDRLRETLEARDLVCGPGGVELVGGDLERGFRLPAARLVVFGEPQLFPRRSLERPTRRSRFGPFLSGLRDLKVGDYVVHSDHGIGQFVGMRTLDTKSDEAPLPPALARFGSTANADVEVMELVYAGGRSLLLPLSRLDQIQKYSGIEGVAPRLDKLGGSSWNRTKSRIKRALRDMASELLKLYAEREVAEAPALDPDSDLQRQFEEAFEYEETKDQREASVAIKADLEHTRPMDRLLCGDVGFGKTEVAMRAAFKVVDNGYQVAVLAPTTILADQHLETFRRRLENFPVTCEMISRFRSAAEVRDIRKRVADGKIDILIGTHRLLSRDVRIPKLALLIVDEEQRFGVAQKERFKKLRKNVHVLAMSATPVPRTLQLSLAGVRDLSVIESAPKDRMAVETGILPFTPELVREAIEYEVERGGQVYYVYNRVETIERMVSYLREVVPGLRITVGHGQLDERELARRMHAFTRGEFDVLVATTIIENGIDIPNVNTMIVHRADRFGLAQLYQLRGRVGRSNQLAYCYLLVPSDRVLSEIARKRLSAIREFSDLGAGFRIAARDLEIRGAGNLLGAEQSGHIAEVGIETYLKMLEDTVRELKGEEPVAAPSAAIDLPVAMTIPGDYIGDTNLRMEMYRRIAAADEGPEGVLAELRDRFGPPPEGVRTLVQVAELKRLAESLGVQSISAQGRKLVFRLRRDARVDVDRLIRFVSETSGAHFSPSGVLTLTNVAGGESLPLACETLETLAHDEAPSRNPRDSPGVSPAGTV